MLIVSCKATYKYSVKRVRWGGEVGDGRWERDEERMHDD
jgi:hypothetical protein